MQFQQPDTLVPDPYHPLDWKRYAYARYNPVKYTDPSGHAVRSDTDENGCSGQGPSCIIDMYGYDTESADDSLEAWYLQHPGYDPNLDTSLEQTDQFIVSSAISRARCDGGSKWDCAAMLTIASMASYGMTGMGPDGPIGNTPGPNKNFVKDTIGDPDCPGCGYVTPSRPAISPPTNPGNLKKNMKAAGINPPPNMVNPQAHHNLPWKFKDWFASRGLNVNDAQYGRWVQGSPAGQHQNWSGAYNQAWNNFIMQNPNADAQSIINYMQHLVMGGRFP